MAVAITSFKITGLHKVIRLHPRINTVSGKLQGTHAAYLPPETTDAEAIAFITSDAIGNRFWDGEVRRYRCQRVPIPSLCAIVAAGHYDIRIE